VVTEGSKGQVRAHPLLGMEAQLRREVVKGFEELGLAGYAVRHVGVDASSRVVGRQ
jgi:hypothetical protein